MTDQALPPRPAVPPPREVAPLVAHLDGSPVAGIGTIPQVELAANVLNPLRLQVGRFGPPNFLAPFGPLQEFQGCWVGNGFNVIWRPNDPSAPGNANTQEHFLALNLTNEHLAFTAVSSAVPNRGGDEPDISIAALQYLQQISDANFPPPVGGGAMHFEPGLWLVVPGTPDTNGTQTVNRLGAIPHGTTVLAVGTASTIPGAPTIAPVSVTPFEIGSPGAQVPFAEQTLTNVEPNSRTTPLPAGITQALVNNPNSLLTAAIAQMQAAGLTLTSTTALHVDTINPVSGSQSGGGVEGIPFLNPNNAQVAEMSSIFWLETWTDRSGSTCLTLQYTQTVLLNFKGLSWPHITVGNLAKTF